MPQRASIGEKFFETSGNVTVMKKMKKKLSEASEYHLKIVPEAEERSRSTSNSGMTHHREVVWTRKLNIDYLFTVS